MVRIKQRYVVCEILFPDGKPKKISHSEIFHLIQNKIRTLHGDYGAAVTTESMASLTVKYLSKDTHMVLIRTKRSTLNMVQSTLTLIAKSRNVSMIFKTLHVGGTIRSCKKYLIGYYKKKLTTMLGTCTNEEEKTAVQTAILDSCKTCKRNLDLLDRVVRERMETKQQDAD